MASDSRQRAEATVVRFTQAFSDALSRDKFPDDIRNDLETFREDQLLLDKLRGSGSVNVDGFTHESYISYRYSGQVWYLIAGQKALAKILENPTTLVAVDGPKRLQAVFSDLGVEPMKPVQEISCKHQKCRAERWAKLRPLIFVDCVEDEDVPLSVESSGGTSGQSADESNSMGTQASSFVTGIT